MSILQPPESIIMNNPDLTYIAPYDGGEENWNHHRNGVSGVGFRTRRAEGAYAFEFMGFDEDHSDDDDDWYEYRPVLVPENEIEILDDTERVRKINCFGGPQAHAWLVNVDLVAPGNNGTGTFLVFYHGGNLPDTPNGCICVDKMPDVRFFFNSWRPEWIWEAMGAENLFPEDVTA